MKNKKAAIEMSMGTIIILVLGVSMLILGMVLIRSIMCSGIQISDQLTSGVRNEIKDLFGGDQYGIKCMGQGGAEVKLPTNGRRSIVCIIKEDASATYDIVIDKKDVTSLTAAVSDATVQGWILGKPGASDIKVKAGGDGKDVVALQLQIPRNAPVSTIQIKMTSTKNKDKSTEESITSVIDITPVGFIKGAIC